MEPSLGMKLSIDFALKRDNKTIFSAKDSATEWSSRKEESYLDWSCKVNAKKIKVAHLLLGWSCEYFLLHPESNSDQQGTHENSLWAYERKETNGQVLSCIWAKCFVLNVGDEHRGNFEPKALKAIFLLVSLFEHIRCLSLINYKSRKVSMLLLTTLNSQVSKLKIHLSY